MSTSIFFLKSGNLDQQYKKHRHGHDQSHYDYNPDDDHFGKR
jgi:hypothetical protein